VGNRLVGWLPRVEIDLGGGSLTVGAELRYHRSTHWGKISYAENLPANFDPEYHFYEYNGVREMVSLYGHELFRLSDEITLMGSIQFAYNSYGIEGEKFLGNTFVVPYFFVNPRAGINYNMTEELTGYVSFAYTSREPRMRNLYAAEDSWFGATPQFAVDTSGGVIRYDFGRPLAKPEHLLDIELGGRLASPDVQIALSAFWMEFRDELVKNGQVDIFGQPVTGNADRTRHYGVEVEGAVRLTDRFTLSGNGTLSKNLLVRYTLYGEGGRADVLDGNPIAGFPAALGTLRLTYRDDSLVASIHFTYAGSFSTDNTNSPERRNAAYRVWNGEVVYRLPRLGALDFSLRGEVRNILDDFYFLSGEGDAFFPAAERNYVFGITLTL
jgi:iron complex outermembrane receptor protein